MHDASDGVEAGLSAVSATAADLHAELLCECGAADCSETVSLAPAAVEALCRTGRPVLAPGHKLSDAQDAYFRAATARADSHALRAQSAHQVRRAERNLAAARLEVGRVLVVDDSDLFRRLAHTVLSATTRLRPLGEAGSGEEALRLLPDLQPNLVLLDIQLPGLNGIETARIIRERSPATTIVLISADAHGVEAAGLSAGAVAVLDKRDLLPQTLDELWLEHGPGRLD